MLCRLVTSTDDLLLVVARGSPVGSRFPFPGQENHREVSQSSQVELGLRNRSCTRSFGISGNHQYVGSRDSCTLAAAPELTQSRIVPADRRPRWSEIVGGRRLRGQWNESRLSVLKAEASCPTKAFEYYYYQQIVWSRSRTEYESFDFDNSPSTEPSRALSVESPNGSAATSRVSGSVTRRQ